MFPTLSRAMSLPRDKSNEKSDFNGTNSDPCMKFTCEKEQRNQTGWTEEKQLVYSEKVSSSSSLYQLNYASKVQSTPVSPSVSNSINSLNEAKEICIHNGNAALKVGQDKKANIWKLLSEVLDNMANGASDGYDGWKGFRFDSLGRNLLQEILNYYERQGDVQMLATIVAVVGNGKFNWDSNEDVLLLENVKRCDVYIHLYANMLYSWGLVETSAELKKYMQSSLSAASCDELRGLTFAPRCLECDMTLPANTSICQNCKTFAFKCSICTNPVRGLFTVCLSCGHGGHFEHMTSWFSQQSVCPTGCGCPCRLYTFRT